MARLLFTASADADSAAIFAYLEAKAGKPTVVKYRASFSKLYRQLADFPDSGSPRETLGPRMRIGVASPYIVVYRYTEADSIVTVLRIVHGSRKITGRML